MLKSMISCGLAMFVAAGGFAQTLDPVFAADYVIDDLGSVPAVPGNYGGLTFSQVDSNIMLIGGAANAPFADIYAVRVSRNIDGFITGFVCGDGQFFADAHGTAGGIDGGLTYGPGGVLFYTTYSNNQVGQIKPGSTGPDRLIDLTPLGVWPSTGSLMFVPDGFSGAGRLKFVSFNGGTWHDATVAPDGNGTYDVTLHGAMITIGGGPEGAVYVAGGNPGFANDSILVSEWGTGRIVTYEADANGDPIVATQRVMITGLAGAEGAAIDPVTGDFLFSTFGGGNRVVRVSGFTTITNCPGDINLDNVVELTDLALLLANFGQVGIGDLDGNCTTDLIDLAILLSSFGSPCP
ncbi:MAG: hypothetical protein ACKVS9_07025 [Phycisphaerae bacterium]